MSWTADRLARLRDDAGTIVTIAAAVEAGLFRTLASIGPASADEVASKAGLDLRAVRIALPALVRIGLVEREDDRFQLSRDAARLLGDPQSPEYVGGGMGLWLTNLRHWTVLPEVLRTGAPTEAEERSEEEREAAIARFMAGMAAAPRERTERLVNLVLERAPEPRNILDLGGGPGHIARAFADRGAQATLLDLPETVDHVAASYGLAEDERIDLVGADFTSDPLPEGPFDIALLSNVTHMLRPEQNERLLRKVRGAMREGGVVAIADFVRGRSPRADTFALVMLLRTERGDTYTEADYGSWLEAADFRDVQILDLDAERQLITAVAG